MRHRELNAAGIGGINLYAQAWLPEAAPRAVIVVSHGLGEHGGRYETLARELGQYGVRINSIHPGYIWGRSVEWYFGWLAEQRGITAEEVYAEIASETCLGYLPHSSEIAGTVVYLASPLSKPVTGQTINVNCGHWIQ